jgi:putative transposase
MYPTPAQAETLLDMHGAHQRLYNALEQRITAWRMSRSRVDYVMQAADLTELRADDETYADLNAQSSQNTLKRLDRAFDSFFRRCRNRSNARLSALQIIREI